MNVNKLTKQEALKCVFELNANTSLEHLAKNDWGFINEKIIYKIGERVKAGIYDFIIKLMKDDELIRPTILTALKNETFNCVANKINSFAATGKIREIENFIDEMLNDTNYKYICETVFTELNLDEIYN